MKLHLGVLPKLLQVPEHGFRIHIPLVNPGRHGLHGDLLQAQGDVWNEFPGRHGFGADVLDGHGHRGVPIKGQAPGEHLIENHAGRVDIRPGVNMAASGLLRGNIVHRPQGLLGQGVLGGGHDPGNAKVSHLHTAVPEHHNILGLNIPVNDPPAVGVSQGPDNLRDKIQGLPPVQATFFFLHILLEGNAVDELHDDIVQIIPLADIVHRDDVGVGEHGNCLGLLMEPAAEFRIGGQVPL